MLVVILVITFGVLAYMKYGAGGSVLSDVEFGEKVEYVCSTGGSIDARFGSEMVRISLADKKIYTLERISVNDEDGVKFANNNDEVVFWVKDDISFLEESGVTTHSACRSTNLNLNF